MSEPIVVQVIRSFRAGLLSREQQQMQAMAKQWVRLEGRLERNIDDLLDEISWRAEQGRDPGRYGIYNLDRYKALLAQTRAELAQYQHYTLGQVESRRAELAGLGVEQADKTIEASYGSYGLYASFNHLDTAAVENIVALLQRQAPLGQLIEQAWPNALVQMADALADGVALGWNPRKTARAMYRGLETGLDRCLRIARTEQLRAYRTATVAEYRESGVVRGFKRVCAKDLRTCLACLAADGTLYSLEREMFDHVSGRCTCVPVLEGLPEPQWQTGAQWFAGLDEDKQRQLMGNTRYQAWAEGRIEFADLASETSHPTWGDGLRVTTLRELGIARQKENLDDTNGIIEDTTSLIDEL